MPSKYAREWFLPLQWGKVALVSWGDAAKPPVLMIHGYMDSAATFIPLVERLPDTYYYVAFDLPGHGRSDPFPKGHLVSTAEHVEVVRRVVDSMKWDSAMFITHSVAFFVAVVYNCVYPDKVTKIVNLDPRPPMATYCFSQYDLPFWFSIMYQDFYGDYESWYHELPKEYTYDEAVNTIARNRKLTRAQAEIVLSRVLVLQDNGKYKLSWEARLKKLSALPITEKIVYEIVSAKPPPMLNILASEDNTIDTLKPNSERLLKKFQNNIPNYTVITVTGSHDVHLNNPDIFVNDIVEFLNKDFGKVKARL